MFSLDVAVWKGKRSEHEAALKKAKQRASPTLPRVVHDKKIKQIYGKTPCVLALDTCMHSRAGFCMCARAARLTRVCSARCCCSC